MDNCDFCSHRRHSYITWLCECYFNDTIYFLMPWQWALLGSPTSTLETELYHAGCNNLTGQSQCVPVSFACLTSFSHYLSGQIVSVVPQYGNILIIRYLGLALVWMTQLVLDALVFFLIIYKSFVLRRSRSRILISALLRDG